MSQPGYPGSLPAARVAERLRQATATAQHRFISDSLSLLNTAWFDTEKLLAHRQITNAYLLGLAVANDLRFITFDGHVTRFIVPKATPAQVVILADGTNP